jgi:hypothetical protein
VWLRVLYCWRLYGTYCKPRENNSSRVHKWQAEGRKPPFEFLGADSEAGDPKSSGHLAVLLAAPPPSCTQASDNCPHNKADPRQSRQCRWHVIQALAVESAVGAGLAELEACAPFVCRLNPDRFIFQSSPHLTPVFIPQHTPLFLLQGWGPPSTLGTSTS